LVQGKISRTPSISHEDHGAFANFQTNPLIVGIETKKNKGYEWKIAK